MYDRRFCLANIVNDGTIVEWICCYRSSDNSITRCQFRQKKESKKSETPDFHSSHFYDWYSIVHDPIHRHLIDDENEDENRIWCVVNYSKRLKNFDSIIDILHFSLPLLINFISALLIIWGNCSTDNILQTTFI